MEGRRRRPMVHRNTIEENSNIFSLIQMR